MSKTARVLEVGNCGPDHASISAMLKGHFSVEIDRVMHVHEAVGKMRNCRYDLVLLNRLIFADGSEGIELLRQANSDPDLQGVPIMMLSNFAEAQRASVAAGGVPGFGKAAIGDSKTVALLGRYLSWAVKEERE